MVYRLYNYLFTNGLIGITDTKQILIKVSKQTNAFNTNTGYSFK
jgi:hypothetical protein